MSGRTVAAAALTLTAAIGATAAGLIAARERALNRAAGPYDADGVCCCRVCATVRGSGIVARALSETKAQDAAAQRLRALSPDGEW